MPGVPDADVTVCSIGPSERASRGGYEAAAAFAKALRQQFTVYGEVLDRVKVFKYLGRLITMTMDEEATQAK